MLDPHPTEVVESRLGTPRRRWPILAGVLLLGLWTHVVDGAPAAPGKSGRQLPPPHAVSRLNQQRAADRLEAGLGKTQRAAPDTLRLAALRVEFPGLAFGESPPPERHDRFWFEVQFSYVREYFDAASLGATTVQVDVPDVVAIAAQEQEYYGDFAAYDSLMIELLQETLPQFEAAVDYRDYDGVILLHAGPGQESDLKGDSPRQIWSGYLDQQSFIEQLSTVDSVVTGIPTQDGGHEIRDVIILPEWEVQDLLSPDDTRLGHLGVYVHEVGQKLGMIPMFDPDPSPIPDSQGIGNFGVMGYGLWVANGFIPTLPGAFNRALMGWVQPREVGGDEEVMLRDWERGPSDSVLVRVPISGSEYYLVNYVVEDPDGPQLWICQGDTIGYQPVFHFDDKNDNCRFDYEDTNGDGFLSPGDLIDSYAGAEWDFFMTDPIGLNTAGYGYGLLIQHVDELRLIEVLRQAGGSVQSDPRRKAVDIEEADGIEDLDRGADNPRSFGSFEDYWLCDQEFGPHSIPSTMAVDGTPTGLRLTLVDLPDSTATTAGGRARLRVERGRASADPLSPQRLAMRRLAGWQGTDLVGMPFGSSRAMVVPADSGRVFLFDLLLDEAPLSDGDPATVNPWQVVPPEWAGTWSAPPVVGDLDGDGVPELVLVAQADSAQHRLTRVFAWRQDGSEFVDLDGDPGSNTGLVASLAGGTERLMLFDLHADPGLEIVVVTHDSTVTTVHVLPGTASCGAVAPTPAAAATAGVLLQFVGDRGLVAGPVGVRDESNGAAPAALAWLERDPTTQRLLFLCQAVDSCGALAVTNVLFLGTLAAEDAPAQMLTADFDGDGDDDVAMVHVDGLLRVIGSPADGRSIDVIGHASLGDRTAAPLAVADMDGNGTLELLVSGEQAFHVTSFSGAALPRWPYRYATDFFLSSAPHPGRRAASPLVADFDGDLRMDILVPLEGGAAVVLDAQARRQPDMEATLPGGAVAAPAILAENGRPYVASLGRFERAIGYDPVTDSLGTRTFTDIFVWDWPRLSTLSPVWPQRGGDGTGSFRAELGNSVTPVSNDASLASFTLGPNPATTELRMRVQLTQSAVVTCTLYNLEGERVGQQQHQGAAGELVEFVFDVKRLASSPYLARMQLSTGGQRVRPFVVRR